MIKLNLGCGEVTPTSWTNVDYAFGAWIAKIPVLRFLIRKLKIIDLNWSNNIQLYDLTKKFPWEDNSVDVIYSSHTLEHMSKEKGQNFLSECHRVLKHGGILRIVVPDLKTYIEKYNNGILKSDDLLDVLYVSYENKGDTKLKSFFAPFIRYPHRCMYDYTTLSEIIMKKGFTIQPSKPFVSGIRDIEQIELIDRTIDAVIVEGVKV